MASVSSNRPVRAAYYASDRGLLGDCWTLLHPPYTVWHLSYVVMGAALASTVDLSRLAWTLLTFFLAVGVAAHVFDELAGRPLRTRFSDAALWSAGIVSVFGAAVISAVGVIVISPWLLVIGTAGFVLLIGYNLELGGGVLHSDTVFALAWGAYPVLVGGFVMDERLGPAVLVLSGAAFLLSRAQRVLSLRARAIRRNVVDVQGSMIFADGHVETVNADGLLKPIEVTLRTLGLMSVVLAVALLIKALT